MVKGGTLRKREQARKTEREKEEETTRDKRQERAKTKFSKGF